MSSIDVVNMLRLYHEQESEHFHLQDLEDELATTCDLNLKEMSLDQLCTAIISTIQETEEMKEKFPKMAAANHQKDMDEALTLLKNEYNSLVSTLSPSSIEETCPVSEELVLMEENIKTVNALLLEVEALQTRLSEQMHEINILDELK